MRMVINDHRIFVELFTMCSGFDAGLQFYKMTFYRPVKIDYFAIHIIEYFHWRWCLCPKYGSPSQKRFTIQIVRWNEWQNVLDHLLFATIIGKWWFHFFMFRTGRSCYQSVITHWLKPTILYSLNRKLNFSMGQCKVNTSLGLAILSKPATIALV